MNLQWLSNFDERIDPLLLGDNLGISDMSIPFVWGGEMPKVGCHTILIV